MTAPGILQAVGRVTALETLTSDARDAIAEHLPQMQIALANTQGLESASITVKISFKARTPATENSAGKPLRVEVSARASLPSNRCVRAVEGSSLHGEQLVLLAAE